MESGAPPEYACRRVKRFTVLFPIVVAALFVYAFVAARFGRTARAIPTFTPTRPPQFVELAPALGTASLSGRVLDIDGAPVAGVSLYFRSSDVPYWSVTDERGEFHFEGLVDEELAVALLHWGHAPRLERTRPGRVEFRLPAPSPEPARIPDVPTADLGGRVMHPLGRAELDQQGYEVVLSPRTRENELGPAVERRARTDRGGAFLFEDLALATYDVHVRPAWAAGSDWPELAAEDFAWIEHAGEASDLRVLLRAGRVQGTVSDSDGTALEGAQVLLAANDDSAHVWLPQMTDAAGRFVWNDVPPGSYRISARAGEGALIDVPVEVEAGSPTRVELSGLETRKRPLR